MSRERVTYERHVLGSGPALVDSGKDTFGWTPALAGERAAKLKAEVPWGMATARMDDPPRLEGSVSEVLAPDNYDRLRFAVLSIDRRMGFSMWGAIGSRPPERAVWRVVTHTILLDEPGFYNIGGNPFALLALPEAGDWLQDLVRPGSFDERHEIKPISLEANPDMARAGELLRRREMGRLRARLLQLLSVEALEEWLAAIYAGLSQSESVVLTSGAEHRSELLIRLAWLSLPVADRRTVTFATEQGASGGKVPRLAVLDAGEWRGRVPENALELTDASLSLVSPSVGQRIWARDLARENLGERFRVDVRPAGRSFRLLGVSSSDAYVHYQALRAAAAGEEPTGSGRRPVWDEAVTPFLRDAQDGTLLCGAQFAGFLMGLAACRVDGGPRDTARRLLDAVPTMAAAPGSDPVCVVRGAVRALLRGSAPHAADALLLRCLSVTQGIVPADELRRLLPSRPEARAGKAAAVDIDAAATFLATMPALEGGGPSFAGLSDAAVERLATEPARLAEVLGSLEVPGPAPAVWVVSLFERAWEVARYRPGLEALLGLFPFRATPTVGRFLATDASLETVLHVGREHEVRTFLSETAPDAGELAASLHRTAVIQVPEGTAEAIRYLAGTPARTHRALSAWSAAAGSPAELLPLLLHTEWRSVAVAERTKAAADLLASSGAAERGQSGLFASILDRLAETEGHLRDEEVALVNEVLIHLVTTDALQRIRPESWSRVVERADVGALSRLDGILARLSRTGAMAFLFREQLEHLSRAVLTRAISFGEMGILRRQLADLPPSRCADRWREVVQTLPATALRNPDVVSVFAKALGDGPAALALDIFVAALVHANHPSQDHRETLLQLAWGHDDLVDTLLGRASYPDFRSMLPVLFQLLVHPAPLPLLLELETALQRIALKWPGRLWDECEPWAAEVEKYSPATVAAFQPHPSWAQSRNAILLPQERIAPLIAEAQSAAAFEPS